MYFAIVLMIMINLSFWYGRRTENNGLWLLDVDRDHYPNLCQVPRIQNLGLEHFYAAFGLGCFRNLRTSSARAFGIKEDDMSKDCSVASAIAHRLQPLQHGIPCEMHIQKKAKTTSAGIGGATG